MRKVVVTTGTTGASAETESGTEGGEAPVVEKEALHTKAKRKKESGGIENPLLSKYLPKALINLPMASGVLQDLHSFSGSSVIFQCPRFTQALMSAL